MQLDKIHNVFFVGIGGIGMSALARYFLVCGKEVAGYDKTASLLTKELESEGIYIHYHDDISLIPPNFISKEDTLVVRTPAVPDEHTGLKYFIENGFNVKKRSEVLGQIVNEKKGIGISGTHGKTTISTMVAYLLDSSRTGCSAFLGGISKNFNSNLIINTNSEYVVTEADEFDRSFHQLHPFISLVTAVDADHLDIYGSYDEVVVSFEKYLSQTNNSGIIIKKSGLELDISSGAQIYSYSLDDIAADYYARNITLNNFRYSFDVVTPQGIIENLQLNHIGITNVENAVAAIAIAVNSGVTFEEIQESLPGFSGIKRRFDIQYQNGSKLFIDDYAHHPKEIEAFLKSIRSLYPDKRITGIFQPHLYSRTKDFAKEFGRSLSLLDELLLLDIYPAREQPIEGVTSDIILNNVTGIKKHTCSKNDCIKFLKINDIEILVTIGAGDIEELVEPIKNKFLDEKKK